MWGGAFAVLLALGKSSKKIIMLDFDDPDKDLITSLICKVLILMLFPA